MLISKLPIINNDQQRLIFAIILTIILLTIFYSNDNFGQPFSIAFEKQKSSLYQEKATDNLGDPTVSSESDSMDTPDLIIKKYSNIQLFIRNKITTTNKKIIEDINESEPITDKLTTTSSVSSFAETGAISLSEIREKLLVEITPTYSYLARERMLEGSIILKLTVSPKGSVTIIDIIKSTGHSLLDYAALSATKKWMFKTDNKIPEIKEYKVEIEFVLERKQEKKTIGQALQKKENAFQAK